MKNMFETPDAAAWLDFAIKLMMLPKTPLRDLSLLSLLEKEDQMKLQVSWLFERDFPSLPYLVPESSPLTVFDLEKDTISLVVRLFIAILAS